MLKIRRDILQKLKCSHCDGYLNVTPIMAKTDKSQICGKCFKILPLQEKMKCVRQVGYEAVAETLLFPCRYNLQGCQSEFPLNEADNHELECPFRFDALESNEQVEEIYEDLARYNFYAQDGQKGQVSPQEEKYDSYCTSPVNTFTASDNSEFVTVECNYNVKENKLTHTPTILKYDVTIFGNDNKGSSLFLRSSRNVNSETNMNPQKVTVEGAISLSTFQSVFCKVSICPIATIATTVPEPMYDTIPDKSHSDLPRCANCCGSVKNEIYYCTFGHDACKNCKGNTCARCATPINCVPRYYCENYSKGCHVYLLYSELYLHSKDCEFGEFECPQERCSVVTATLSALKDHLKDTHLASIISSNLVVKQASKKDECWVMLAFDSLFKCKRFCYYEEEVEFVVEFIGPHKNASDYKYEVYVKSHDNTSVKLMKSATCCGWDASAMDQSIVISRDELNSVKIDILNFTYTLNLAKVSIKE